MPGTPHRQQLQMRVSPVVAMVAIGCVLGLGLLPAIHVHFAHGPGNPSGADHCPVCLQLAVALFAVLAVFVLLWAGSREAFPANTAHHTWISAPLSAVAARAPPVSS